MTTTVMSMATKPSDSDDQITGDNLQIEGHALTSPSSGKSLEQKGAAGNAPFCSPSQSPDRQLLPGHPETQYCLGLHITLTKERGAAPLPPHTWMVPVVEDML